MSVTYPISILTPVPVEPLSVTESQTLPLQLTGLTEAQIELEEVLDLPNSAEMEETYKQFKRSFLTHSPVETIGPIPVVPYADEIVEPRAMGRNTILSAGPLLPYQKSPIRRDDSPDDDRRSGKDPSAAWAKTLSDRIDTESELLSHIIRWFHNCFGQADSHMHPGGPQITSLLSALLIRPPSLAPDTDLQATINELFVFVRTSPGYLLGLTTTRNDDCFFLLRVDKESIGTLPQKALRPIDRPIRWSAALSALGNRLAFLPAGAIDLSSPEARYALMQDGALLATAGNGFATNALRFYTASREIPALYLGVIGDPIGARAPFAGDIL